MNWADFLCRTFITNISMAFRVGANLGSKLKLMSLSFIFPLRKLFKLQDKVNVNVVVQQFGRTAAITIFQESDYVVLREIFYKGEYDVQVSDPKIIVDLGGNVGLSAIYLNLRYPGCRMYVFEPDPLNFKKLKHNTANFKNIKCFNWAIADRNGSMTFYQSTASLSSSLVPRQSSRKIKVSAKTLDYVLSHLGLSSIDLLKFDIEGGEYAVFSSSRQLGKVKAFVGEVHLDLMSVSEKTFLSCFKGYNVRFLRHSPVRMLVFMTKNKNTRKASRS